MLERRGTYDRGFSGGVLFVDPFASLPVPEDPDAPPDDGQDVLGFSADSLGYGDDQIGYA